MYENFYQLESSPFRLGPDPRFFFGSKCHNRALAYLRYGLKQKEGFIVVTGSPGTGKTTLARALLEDVGRDKIVIAELNTTHLKPDDVLRMTAASFGLEHEGATKATLLTRLEGYFLGRYRAGYHVLLIVDESQNLPFESIEELRMLSNFYTGKHALIQIFLLGQQQFRDQLYSANMEQLRQRVVASCHLEPLSQIETKEYIEHRLTLAGWQQDPQITDRAYARIFQMTKGVPRRINTFCDRLFLFCSLEEIHEIKDEQIKAIAKELKCELSNSHDETAAIEIAELDKEVTSVDNTLESDSTIFENFSDEVVIKDIRQKKTENPPPVESKPIIHSDAVDTYPSNTPSTRSMPLGNTAVQSYEPAVSVDTESHPDWWKLVALAVNDYRHQNDDSVLTDFDAPLSEGVTEMLQIAVGKMDVDHEMRVGELQGIDDETIHLACVYYIKNAWITNKANYYRRLGVDNNASLSHIRTHYRYLFRLLQTDLSAENKQDENAIRRINQSFSILRSEKERRDYDDFLLQVSEEGQKNKATNDYVPCSSEAISDKSDNAEINIGKTSRGIFFPLILSLAVGGAGAAYYYQESFDGLLAQAKERVILLLPQSDNVNTPVSAGRENPVSEISEEFDGLIVGDVVFEEVIASDVTSDAAILKDTVVETKVTPLPMPTQTILKQPPDSIKKPLEPVTVKPIKVTPQLVEKTVLSNQNSIDKASIPIEEVDVAENKPEAIVEISDVDLLSISARFSQAYEKGVLDDFMSMFSADVLTNENKDWAGIKEDYGTLFESTDMRKIDLLNMMWKKSGQSATGNGDFLVTVQSNANDDSRNFNGKIKFEVKKQEKKTYIKGMYYSYAGE